MCDADTCAHARVLELRPELSEPDVTTRLVQALRLGDTGQRAAAFYLLDVQERKLYQLGGYGNLETYAEQALDLERRRLSELLVTASRLRDLPAIDAAFCEGRINWSKVLIVTRMATPEVEAEWLAEAETQTCAALRRIAQHSKRGQRPVTRTKGLPEVRFPLRMALSTLGHEKWAQAKAKLSAERDATLSDAAALEAMVELILLSKEDGSLPGRTVVDDSMYRVVLHARAGASSDGEESTELTIDTELGPVPVTGGVAAAVACDATCVHEDETHGALDRKTPPALRARVLLRDGHRCRCCGSRQSLMVHHIRFRSHGGATTAWNLITLCARCHALVHDELLVIEGERAEDATFVNKTGAPLDQPETVAAVTMTPTSDASRSAGYPADPTTASVTLDAVPEEIDGAWWSAHAHLLSCRAGGEVTLAAGYPADPVAGYAAETRTPDPNAFEGLIGQRARIERLELLALGPDGVPHTLFEGPPGCGKTTFARAVAQRTGSRLVEAPGPLLARTDELLCRLASLRAGDALFIDEVHAVPAPVLEVLYQAMAEGTVSLTLRQGAAVRAVRLRVPRFALLGATTDRGALAEALVSRFGLIESFGHYPTEALARLVRSAGYPADVGVTRRASRRIAEVSRGTPREALRLKRLAAGMLAGREDATIRHRDVARLLAHLGIDRDGLRPEDRRYLGVLDRSADPVPLGRLARTLGVTVRTLTHHIEPFLFMLGVVRMTSRGRTTNRRPRLVGARL